MARPSKLTPAQWAEVQRINAIVDDSLGLITLLLDGKITERDAKSCITEDDGFSLSLLKRQATDDSLPVLDWVSSITTALKFEYVYIFKGSHNGMTSYKIGKAKSIKDRRAIFSVKLPFDIDLVALFRVKNGLQSEAAIHKAHTDKRMGGEWFSLAPDDFDAVCRQGISIELADLAEAIRENVYAKPHIELMDDKQYIAYMEALLAVHGISFSREVGKNNNGDSNGA